MKTTTTSSKRPSDPEGAPDITSLSEYTKYLQSIITAGYGVPSSVLLDNFDEFRSRTSSKLSDQSGRLYITVVNGIGHSETLYSLINNADTIETIIPSLREPFGLEVKARRGIVYYFIVRELHQSRDEWLGRVKEAYDNFKLLESGDAAEMMKGKRVFDDPAVEAIFTGKSPDSGMTTDELKELGSSLKSRNFRDETSSERSIAEIHHLTKGTNLNEFIKRVDGKPNPALLNYKDCGVYNMFFSTNFPSAWSEFMESQEPVIREISVSLSLDGGNIRPPLGKLCNPFFFSKPQDIRVVILGQDPYPTKGHAMGLSFSAPNTLRTCPKSLLNIKKAVIEDGYQALDNKNSLECWAKQGVFLLNAALTFNGDSKEGIALWRKFTNSLIRYLCSSQRNICFMLWGNFAKKYSSMIDLTRGHFIISSQHPSPLANTNKSIVHFSKLGHFKRYNREIEERSLQQTHRIDWNIV